MTSRNSFYNLIVQDFKQRLWSFALSCVFFFFVFPVSISFVSSMLAKNNTHDEYITDLLDYFYKLIVNENKILTFFLILLAIIIALNGFGYLNDKNKVDFFHSLPISRTKLFAIKYITGILIVAVPYLVFSLLGAILTMIFTGFNWLILSTFSGFLYQMLMFFLCYHVTIFAITLTGTTIMNIFGTKFFFIYVPAIIVLNMGYKESYYNTYVGIEDKLGDILRYSSPFALAMTANSASFPSSNPMLDLLVAVLMIVVFIILSIIVFRYRHSESAGKAISIVWLKAPLKILVVIPSGLFFALFMSLIVNNIIWTIFGMMCGILISHCVIEIIYHADFKKLFANKIHLAICFFVSLCIVLIHNYDLLGYDTYKPKLSNISSIGVNISALENNAYTYHNRVYSYYDPHESYQSPYKIIVENMYITDSEIISEIVNNAVEYEKENGNYVQNGNILFNYEYNTRDDARLRYRLKNGKMVDRDYTLDSNKLKSIYQKLYESEEYKNAVYPLLTSTIDDYTVFNFKKEIGENYNDKVYRLKDEYLFEKLENAEDILKTYQEEFSSLKYDEKNEMHPIAYIRFLNDKDAKLIDGKYKYNIPNQNEVKPTFDEVQAKKNSKNEKVVEDITDYGYDVGYYPIYVTFEKTIQLLEENGMKVE